MSSMNRTAVDGNRANNRQVTNRIEGSRRGLALATVMLTMFFASLDQTVVSTSMPAIITDLKGLSLYAWVFTAYMMGAAITVPIYGKLSDVYGRKPFYLLGLGLFIVGSAISGQAQTIGALIAARAFQGIGAGAMLSMPRATIGDIFNPRERGRWLGAIGSVFALSSILGPTLGGWITDTWGWRWVFYINLPFGVLALLGVMMALPSVRTENRVKVDWVGSLLLAGSLVPLLLAFTWAGSKYAWGSTTLIMMFAGAVVGLVLFFLWEGRAAEPVLPATLFGNSIFTVSAVASLLAAAGMFGCIMFIPLFFQGVLGLTATHSGQFMTPMMLSLLVAAIAGGVTVTKTGRYKVVALLGGALFVLGAYLLTTAGLDTTRSAMVRNMALVGLGLGLLQPVLNVAVQNAFPYKQMGVVNASVQFVSSLGGVIAAPILGTIMKNAFAAELPKLLPAPLQAALAGAGGLKDQLLANPQALAGGAAMRAVQAKFAAFGPEGEALFRGFVRAVQEALATGIAKCFVIGVCFAAAAFVVVWFLRQIPLKRDEFFEEDGGTAGRGASVPTADA